MESEGSKGYLLPAIIDPGAYRCFALYVPDDPLYISALSGHLHDLAKWQAWEKDGTNRAAQAAAVWKDAIDLSIQKLWLGALIMSCDDVQTLLDLIQNLTVNVSVGGGCCGNPITTYKFPDGWETDTTTYPPPPPPTTTPPTSTQDVFCDMCWEAWTQMYEMIGGFAQSLSEYEPYYSIAAFFNTIALAAPVAGDVYEAVSTWVLAQYGNLVTDCESYMIEMQEALICAMYGSYSSGDCKAQVTSVITDWPAIPYEVRQWLLALYSGLQFNPMFDDTLVVRASLVGSSCVACVGNNPTWQNLLFTPIDDAILTAQNGAIYRQYNSHLLVPASDHPECQVNGTPPTISGYSFVGIYFEWIQATAGHNRYLFDDLSTNQWGVFYQTTGQKQFVRHSSVTNQDVIDFANSLGGGLQSTSLEDGKWRFGSETAFLSEIEIKAWWVHYQ